MLIKMYVPCYKHIILVLQYITKYIHIKFVSYLYLIWLCSNMHFWGEYNDYLPIEMSKRLVNLE